MKRVRLITIMVACVLAICLCACGKSSSKSNNKTKKTGKSESVQTEPSIVPFSKADYEDINSLYDDILKNKDNFKTESFVQGNVEMCICRELEGKTVSLFLSSENGVTMANKDYNKTFSYGTNPEMFVRATSEKNSDEIVEPDFELKEYFKEGCTVEGHIVQVVYREDGVYQIHLKVDSITY